jgi:hypothetical protein
MRAYDTIITLFLSSQVAKMLIHLSVQEPGDNCKFPG